MTQERQIFIVRAEVVDANGALNPLVLDNVTYPAKFDSKVSPYNGDIDKCLNYAKAGYHHVVEHMLKRDDRQLQTCVLMTADGRIIGEPFHKGAIAPVVVPDPEPETNGNENPGEGA